ncbi:MAG: Fe-S cluster assembly protein SufD [Bacteroidaceae bacterium]|nr:Fe-S cluster assembly protein SufD [Bacteroidaceae bacterium]
MNAEQQYIELYREASPLIKERSCAAMNAVRDDAFRMFEQKGFPTQKVERYKYTDVPAAFIPNYGLSLGVLDIKPSRYIYSFKDAPIDLTHYYNKIADCTDGITALNTALAHEGLLVYVPKNEQPDAPIQIDNWLQGTADTLMNRRVLVVLEEGAEATIIMNDKVGPPLPPSSMEGDTIRQTPPIEGEMPQGQRRAVSFLTTQVMEIVCKAGARLDIYEIEDTTPHCSRFSNVYIQEERDCVVKHNSITLFNGLSRNLCDVYLEGENAEVTLNGCAIGSGRQQIDNNTLIDHRVPNCQSTELYKYVLDDQATGAFAGKILVEKDAQKTTSQETNANLCASREARMYTQPMLEIYADDVKCSHGSTVGILDQTALFYMLQRGIPEAEARTLLKNAFMGQVIDQIQHRPLRDRLYVKVEKRFRGEHEKCVDCHLCK